MATRLRPRRGQTPSATGDRLSSHEPSPPVVATRRPRNSNYTADWVRCHRSIRPTPRNRRPFSTTRLSSRKSRTMWGGRPRLGYGAGRMYSSDSRSVCRRSPERMPFRRSFSIRRGLAEGASGEQENAGRCGFDDPSDGRRLRFSPPDSSPMGTSHSRGSIIPMTVHRWVRFHSGDSSLDIPASWPSASRVQQQRRWLLG